MSPQSPLHGNIYLLHDFNELPHGLRATIYGTGKYAQHLVKWIRQFRHDIKIYGFIDSFRSGVLYGLPVRPLDDCEGDIKEISVIIASHFWKEILSNLDQKKCTIYLPHPYLNIGHHFQSIEYTEVRKRAEKIIEAFPKQDAKMYMYLLSKRYIKKEDLQKRRFINDSEYEYSDYNIPVYPEYGTQYEDYIDWSKVHSIIEGGVYDGVTTLQLSSRLTSSGHIFAFEPEEEAFKKSSEKCSIDRRIQIINAALSDSCGNGYLYMRTYGSCIVENTLNCKFDQKIYIQSIDHFSSSIPYNIDYIKLDIEGNEYKALNGAIQTLVRCRPQLAISIYHTKYEFITIPEFLINNLKEYSFRIGHYSNSLLETILYAIPNEYVN